MFEIGIFCVIFLAMAYWAVLRLIARTYCMASSSKASRLPKNLCALYSRSAWPDPRRPNAPLKPRLRNRRSGKNGWSRC
jgi:hypothetical protein